MSTIPQLFFEAATRRPDSECLAAKRGGKYRVIPYRAFRRDVEALIATLHAKGIEKGDRVALMSTNRPEWPLWDLAVVSLGAVIVPIYPTLTPKQVEWILNDCQARLLVVESAAMLESLASMNTPSIEETVLLEGETTDCLASEALVQEGRDLPKPDLEVLPEDLASIVYTSGTTGNPKGVMLTHGNLATDAETLVRFVGVTEQDRSLSFLPLSHALERIVHLAFFAAGAAIYYAEDVNSVVSNLPEVRPTIMVCVPRVFEKVRSRMLENMLASSWISKNVFFWGLQNGRKLLHSKKPSAWLKAKVAIARALVFQKVQKRFGGRLRFFVSGGASLVPSVAEFFQVFGFEILEGYGLTETSPVVAVNPPGQSRIGTVGPALPGVSIRLAADGEIQIKGPIVMSGYYNRPDLTAEVLSDGWFSTGDIGEWENGYLKIVDRKKELLVMSNGKNVAPQPIENALKKSKLVTMAMVLGDGRNYLTALIVPNWDPLLREAKKLGLEGEEKAKLVRDERVRRLFRAEIDRHLVDFARFEQIKDFALLAEEFSQDKNEMTPTLKYKRQNILQANRHLVDSMYGTTLEHAG